MQRAMKAVLAIILGAHLLNPRENLAAPLPVPSDGEVVAVGKVTARGKGPLENAEVFCLRKGEPESKARRTESREGGSFEFAGLEKGAEYILRVRHRSYRNPEDQTIKPESDRETVEFLLEPFLLRGLLFDGTTGKPVVRAVVHCIRQGEKPVGIGSKKTLDDGRFEFEPLDSNALYTLAVHHWLYEKREINNQQPTDPPEDLNIDLKPISVGVRYDFRTQWGAKLSGRLDRINGDSLDLSFVKTDSPIFRKPALTQTVSTSDIALVSRPNRKKLYILVGIGVGIAVAAAVAAGR